jgi:glycosyltransferase involved in cell wall biosynthesis
VRLVIVHEQANETGGVERILGTMLRRWPEAETVALRFERAPGAVRPAPPSRAIPLRGRKRHYLAPLYARRLGEAPLDGADLVLSLPHNGWALAAAAPPGVPHVAYTAGLSRALYDQAELYVCDYPAPLRPLIRAALPVLRAHDGRLLRRPDRLLTVSRYSARRLAERHGVTAEVIPPPARTGFFTPAPRPRSHFLAVARIGVQKRIDRLLAAFRLLPEERLVVAGSGPELERLRAAAPPNVELVGFVEDEPLRELYRSSHALVCPSIEELGMVVVEAQACGTPAVVRAEGGSREIVAEGSTGLLLEGTRPEQIAAALQAVRRRAWSPEACRQAALRFADAPFFAALERLFEETLEAAAAPAGARPIASLA